MGQQVQLAPLAGGGARGALQIVGLFPYGALCCHTLGRGAAVFGLGSALVAFQGWHVFCYAFLA